MNLSVAFAYVEDVVASNEDLSKFSSTFSINNFFGVSKLHRDGGTSKFMYSSLDWRIPLSSHPHLSITLMTLP